MFNNELFALKNRLFNRQQVESYQNATENSDLSHLIYNNFGLKPVADAKGLPKKNYIEIKNIVPEPYEYVQDYTKVPVNIKALDADTEKYSLITQKEPTGKFDMTVVQENIGKATNVYETRDGKTYTCLALDTKVEDMPLLNMYLKAEKYRLNITRTSSQPLELDTEKEEVQSLSTIRGNLESAIIQFLGTNGISAINDVSFEDTIMATLKLGSNKKSSRYKARQTLVRLMAVDRIRNYINKQSKAMTQAALANKCASFITFELKDVLF